MEPFVCDAISLYYVQMNVASLLHIYIVTIIILLVAMIPDVRVRYETLNFRGSSSKVQYNVLYHS